MKYFKIGYGCGCGDNEDYIMAMSLESANEIAYEAAIEDYESYEGLHGIRGMEDIALEDYDALFLELRRSLRCRAARGSCGIDHCTCAGSACRVP